jgi:hypothetical protein
VFGVILYFHFTWIAQGNWIVLIDIFLTDCLYELFGSFLCSLLLCITDILHFSFLVSCTSCMLLRKAPNLVCQVSLTALIQSFLIQEAYCYILCCMSGVFQTIEQSDVCTQCHGRQHLLSLTPWVRVILSGEYSTSVFITVSEVSQLLIACGWGSVLEKAITCFSVQMAYIHIC